MNAKRKHGEGCIYLRGSIWYLKYREHGKTVFVNTKTENETVARRKLRQILGRIADGRPSGREGEKLTLAALRTILEEDYVQHERRSWSRAKRAFDAVAEALGENCTVARITADRLHTYLKTRLDAGYSRSTVQKELAAVKHALTVAVRRGLLPYRVMFPDLGTIDNARCEFVEGWEWALMRADLPDYWQDLGDMAMEMGWRVRSEFLGLEKGREPLTWARVDFDAGLVRLAKYSTKNKDARVYPFAEAPMVKAALERRRAYTDDVEQRTGKQISVVFHVEGEPIKETGFYGPWRGACRKHAVLGADGRPKRPHDFRRSAVRALEVGGVARSVAKRLVGHKTDSMYSRYSITTTDDLRAAVAHLHAPAPKQPEEAHAG